MRADKKTASIAIEIALPDTEMQELIFEQFTFHKSMLDEILEEEWQWDLHTYDENGRIISRIYKEISPVSVFNRDDWPTLISFFKPRIIALDAFWSDAQYAFEELK